MPAKRSNVIPNGHFHKDWQRYIKCWFDQPMRAKRRHQKRVEKAKRIAPRPLKQLRPVVNCPTLRYNTKLRLGRGFTLEELKQVGMGRKEARTIGISVDLRRTNRSADSLQRNVQRLKEYKSKMILFPLKAKKPHKGDASAEQQKLATQLKGIILPIRNNYVNKDEAPRKITQADRSFEAHRTQRTERSAHKYKGRREKKARLEAEALENKK